MNRVDLKYNFLKQIIIRADFQGVFDTELEAIIPKLKPCLKEYHFEDLEKQVKKNIEIKFPENETETEHEEIHKFERNIIYVFKNVNSGYQFEISKSFVCLNITSTAYSPFDSYIEIFKKILEVFTEQIDFFYVDRIGIRKINVCMLENKDNINTFFSNKYFNIYDGINGIEAISSNKKDFFIKDNYKVNLNCDVTQGRVKDDILYKVLLDVDVYIDNKEVISENLAKNMYSDMNFLLFNIYIEALTDEFRKALTEGDESFFAELIGVESNE